MKNAGKNKSYGETANLAIQLGNLIEAEYVTGGRVTSSTPAIEAKKIVLQDFRDESGRTMFDALMEHNGRIYDEGARLEKAVNKMSDEKAKALFEKLKAKFDN